MRLRTLLGSSMAMKTRQDLMGGVGILSGDQLTFHRASYAGSADILSAFSLIEWTIPVLGSRQDVRAPAVSIPESRATIRPILRVLAQSSFDRIVFDVSYDAGEMLRVANEAVEGFLLPELPVIPKHLVRFVRGVRLK